MQPSNHDHSQAQKNDTPSYSSFSSTVTRNKKEDDLLFTSERSNMDYVTLSGVCKRTGAEEDELAVFLLKELIDNTLDFIESYATPTPAASDIVTIINDNFTSIKDEEPQIHVDITYNDKKHHLIIIVKNSNFGIEGAGFTEQRIHSIFGDLDVFHSSKRNQFKISRGMQGDALKEVLCIPYVLATKYQSYFNGVWNEPLIIRNGFGKQFEIRAVVDKIAQHNYVDIQISEIPANKNGFTEVEVHIPYDPKLSDIVNLTDLRLVLNKYALLNTHIRFHFKVVHSNNTTDTTLPATQALLTKTSSKKAKNKRSSIYYYDLNSFENLIYRLQMTA